MDQERSQGSPIGSTEPRSNFTYTQVSEEKFIDEHHSHNENKLRSPTFEESQLTVETDRPVIRHVLEDHFHSIQEFDQSLAKRLSLAEEWQEAMKDHYLRRDGKQCEC